MTYTTKIKRFFSHSTVQFLTVLVVLLVLRFYPIFLGKVIIFGDNFSLMVPGKIFTAQWLRQGVLPFWNPTIFGGISWIGDINQSVLYPSTLLFMIFQPAEALMITVVGHMILTYTGMYFLSIKIIHNKRAALLSSVLWTLSTQVTGSINNISIIQSIAWAPWVVWAGVKLTRQFSSQVLFVLIAGLQLLGGYPQHVLYSVLTAVTLSVYQQRDQLFSELRQKKWQALIDWFTKWIKKWAITALLLLGMTAFIWLPFIATLQNSTRTLQSSTQAGAGSLLPVDLLKIVVPYLFDKPAAGMKWGPHWNSFPNLSIYLTWFGLVLVALLVIRKKWRHTDTFFAIASGIFLLFSLGSSLPGYLSLQQLIPLLKFSRGPSIALLVVNILTVVWIGDIYSRLKISIKNLRMWFVIAGITAVVSGISLVISHTSLFATVWSQVDQLLGLRLSSSAFHTLERDQAIIQMIVQNIVVNAVLLGLALFVWSKKKITVLALCIAVEMVYNTQAHLLFAPHTVYPTWQEINAAPTFSLLQNPQSRVLVRNYNYPYTGFDGLMESITVRAPFSDSYITADDMKDLHYFDRFQRGLTPDWNMVYQVPAINGYATLVPKDTVDIWKPEISSVAEEIGQPGLIADGVGINSLPEIKLTNPALSDWAVGYYLVDDWFEVSEDLSMYPIVMEKDWWTVYQLPAETRFRYEDSQPIKLANFSQNPNRIQLDFNNDLNHSHLIVADRYDSEWQAYVNGREVQIENYRGMRRIPLEAGKNQVLFDYKPQLFFWGVAISLSTVLTSLLLALTDRVCYFLLNKPE